MSKKIMGAVVGLPSPRSDWNQTDERKADYIKNKPEIVPIEVFSDVHFNRIPALETYKADKSYVEELTADKVDKSYVDEQLKTKVDDAYYQEFKDVTENTVSHIVSVKIPQLEENKADITYVDEQIGDIETALDGIIAIQNSLLGGDSE